MTRCQSKKKKKAEIVALKKGSRHFKAEKWLAVEIASETGIGNSKLHVTRKWEELKIVQSCVVVYNV